MDESLTELLARLREEWKEKISTDGEATQVEIASQHHFYSLYSQLILKK